MAKRLKEFFLKIKHEFTVQKLLVLISVSVVSNFLTDFISKKFSYNISITEAAIFSLCIGTFAALIFDLFEKKVKTLREIGEKIDRYSMSHEILEKYFKISSAEYSPPIEKLIHRLNQKTGLLMELGKGLYGEWNKQIENDEKWRIIFQRVLYSRYDSVKLNKFSLSLLAYLEILLDAIEFSIEWAKDKNTSLIIRSFTNASPLDWFKNYEHFVGEDMAEYSERLKKLINEMKKLRYKYERYILCSNSLKKRGFKSKDEIIIDWKQCENADRERYLDELHTDREHAFLVDLYPEIIFKVKATEFIYFGEIVNGNVNWNFCYICGYSNTNLNVSATFLDFQKPIEFNNFLIDIENLKKIKINDALKPPEKIQVEYQQFPYIIAEKDGILGRIIKIENIVPLSIKWNIASHIWHGKKEIDMLKYFFESQLERGCSVLDCACGTGFHCFLLNENGYKVTGTDNDSGNISILTNECKRENFDIPLKTANWLSLTDTFKDEKFDAVLCLGSSITYFETWSEETKTLDEDSLINKLNSILQNFKYVLKESGKLIIGISRHYNMNNRGTSINFVPKKIDGIMFNMKWTLNLHWKNESKIGNKKWFCEIIGENHDDYSFELLSYLIDIDEFVNLCNKHFKHVSKIDIDSTFYDIFIVCWD